MNTREFVEGIKKFAPNVQDFTDAGFSGPMAITLANSYKLVDKGNSLESTDSIVSLISCYDVSNLEIGMVTFDLEISESVAHYFFGKLELDLLAISKKSNEIVLIDHENTDFVMARCAKNSECFLDALVESWKAITIFLLDETKADDSAYRSLMVKNCTKLAGGQKYFDFYETLIGE